MPTNRFSRTLALSVLAVAVFNTLAAVSMPVPDWRMSPAAMVLLAGVLLAHSALYWWAEQVRARVGLGGYFTAQAAAVFGVGLIGALFPVGVGLYIALTAEAVIVAGPRWGPSQSRLVQLRCSPRVPLPRRICIAARAPAYCSQSPALWRTRSRR